MGRSTTAAAFDGAITATSTTWAPWMPLPTTSGSPEALVARVLVHTIQSLDLQWPQVSEAEHTGRTF